MRNLVKTPKVTRALTGRLPVRPAADDDFGNYQTYFPTNISLDDH